MSGRSYFKRIERMDPDAMGADEPVSAYKAWATRSNVQHLVDSASQYRVNLVAGAGSGGIIAALNPTSGVLSEAVTKWWYATFPITITDGGELPKFHFRIATEFEASISEITLGIHMHGPRGRNLVNRLHTVSSGTKAWSITDKVTPAGIPRSSLEKWETYQSHVDAPNRTALIPYVRFDVSLRVTAQNSTGSGSAYVHGIYVREYV